ncbi:hypothetical protein MNBD_GAMMA23-1679 [hydrothermal vent metagenome]|uniref:Uncharacterized protein n=1 Tax=hydrothermal vent metagenome TaxID=652676 RepID=A0A3B0ZU39_9ZZZZ
MTYLYECDQTRLDKTKSLNPLLKNIPTAVSPLFSTGNKLHNPNSDFDSYNIKINLESIHYTGEDYGYGWTFVISTLKHHWISTQIRIQRGSKSFVNKDIYHNHVDTDFHLLQHLPITLCAQHISGFKAESTVCLNPNSLKQTATPTSIYTGMEESGFGFHFHELLTLAHKNVQFMFVLNFEITPENTHALKN